MGAGYQSASPAPRATATENRLLARVGSGPDRAGGGAVELAVASAGCDRVRSTVQTLSSVLTGLLALGLGVLTIYFVSQAPPHATLGNFSELWAPTLITLTMIVVACAVTGFGAWALWQRDHKMAAQLLGVLTAIMPLMLWKSVDAANVLYDSSAPTSHETKLVETRRNKDQNYLVFESWREPGDEIMIRVGDVMGGASLQPGDQAEIVVYQGAFGRPYATAINPRVAPR